MSERLVRAGDLVLWSESFGDPAHPALLLVMGANASGKSWPDPLVERFASRGLFVIRYDHRDTGRSTRRDFAAHPYSVEDLARDAVSVLDGWGIARAHVFGMSMGCSLGQVLALDHRERLSSLSLTCGAALDVDFVGNLEKAARGEPTQGGLPAPRPEVLQVLARRIDPHSDRATELDRRVAEWRALSGKALPFDAAEFRRWEEKVLDHEGRLEPAMAHAFALPVPLSRGAELQSITTPTLIIEAPEDPLNPPPHARHLAEAIPGAVHKTIPGMGHALPSAVHVQLVDLIVEHARRAQGERATPIC